MATQLLSAEKISNFLGMEIDGDLNGMVEFIDVTNNFSSIEKFEEIAEAGTCFDLGGNDGYVYKICHENDYYTVVVTGATLSNY